MAFTPTKQQNDAIIAPAGTLVSAAAGSGKTAVLVERVINKLCGENPIDADKLLVVTFTNSAAQEMRMRIEKRLNEECRNNPTNKELLKQKIRLKNAKICTIDSFCIDLIRENFDRLSISPDFAIAGDSAAVTDLEQQAVNDVLDEAFALSSEAFLKLLSAGGDDYSEANIRNDIVRLYNYSQNMPFPIEFLNELLEKTRNANGFSELINALYKHIKKKANSLKKASLTAFELLSENEILYKKYSEAYLGDLELLNKIINCCEKENWDGLYSNLSSAKFSPVGRHKVDKSDSAVISASYVRSFVKSEIENIIECYCKLKQDFYSDYIFGMEMTAEIINLTLKFTKRFEELRSQRNIMTFSDTEHKALELLCEYRDGEIVTKESAKDIIERFEEVLVDEFQDTNNMQDILFSVLSNNEKNIFVVGDVKQSIYAFRGANPQNFLSKKNRYIPFENAGEDDLKKIILSSNFRSRKGVCDFVNFLFEILMNGELSSIEYGDEERLSPEASYPESDTNSVEIGFVNALQGDDLRQADAANIAEFILRYKNEGVVTDDITKQLRSPKFSDFTILLRATATDGEIYANTLREWGIPVAFNAENFTEKAEVNYVLSLLSVIENQTREIELLSVMMSPMFGFSADDIAQIRLADKNSNLFSALTVRAQVDKKCADFIDCISRFKKYGNSKSVAGLLNAIYDETDFLNIISVLENGEARRKNLLMLLSFAESYDNFGVLISIGGFIKYVNRVAEKKLKTDFSAQSDAVQISTIHNSKGLQYPICILANTSGKFKVTGRDERIKIDDKFGLAMRFNSPDATKGQARLFFDAITEMKQFEALDEDLRLLYVALTRAKEKLFISICEHDVENKLLGNFAYAFKSGSIEDYRSFAGGFKSYSDLLCYSLILHKSLNEFRSITGFSGFMKDSLTDIDISFKDSDSLVKIEKCNTDIVQDYLEVDTDFITKITDNLNYVYPYEELRNIESKAAVADIAHKAEQRDFSFKSEPAFMQKLGLTPAEIGTATHRFMQFCDFDAAASDLKSEAFRLYDYEFITKKEYEAINLEAIGEFFESDIFGRIQNADRVEREMRFITELPANRIKPDLSENLSDEEIVVQGSVDCVFIENGELVVLDFKTDRIKNPEELSAAYSEQLDIYAKACEKIFELPVKEKIIYSFALSKGFAI